MRATSATSGLALTLALALIVAACTDDPAVTPAADAVVPSARCADGEYVALIAYDRQSGAFEWAACAAENARRDVVAATDDAVYLAVTPENSHDRSLVAYGTADGSELPDGGPAESRPDLPGLPTGPTTGTLADGVLLRGGQGQATTAVDDATGEVLWTHPGSPAYDDLWATGDGAVFLIRADATGAPELVGYELHSGDERWAVALDRTDIAWPWLVTDDRLYAIWNNLAVVSTDDGSIVWRTEYPFAEFPRMSSVAVNADTVFVAFSGIAADGD